MQYKYTIKLVICSLLLNFFSNRVNILILLGMSAKSNRYYKKSTKSND